MFIKLLLRVLSLFLLAVLVQDEGDGGCGSSSGSGIVFVSLLQNLITGEPGSSEDQVRRSVDGVIFTTD